MRFIDPRFLLFKYIPLFSADQNRRLDLRTRITSCTQVMVEILFLGKFFELYVYYVDYISFLLNSKFFWLTLLKILKTEGVNQTNERPMITLDGTN
jgi:undecaprenyl phosphate N,N'-diacetylbacillosamine 1-phosphate transferase